LEGYDLSEAQAVDGAKGERAREAARQGERVCAEAAERVRFRVQTWPDYLDHLSALLPGWTRELVALLGEFCRLRGTELRRACEHLAVAVSTEIFGRGDKIRLQEDAVLAGDAVLQLELVRRSLRVWVHEELATGAAAPPTDAVPSPGNSAPRVSRVPPWKLARWADRPIYCHARKVTARVTNKFLERVHHLVAIPPLNPSCHATPQKETFSQRHGTSSAEHEIFSHRHRPSSAEHQTFCVEHETFCVEHETFCAGHAPGGAMLGWRWHSPVPSRTFLDADLAVFGNLKPVCLAHATAFMRRMWLDAPAVREEGVTAMRAHSGFVRHRSDLCAFLRLFAIVDTVPHVFATPTVPAGPAAWWVSSWAPPLYQRWRNEWEAMTLWLAPQLKGDADQERVRSAQNPPAFSAQELAGLERGVGGRVGLVTGAAPYPPPAGGTNAALADAAALFTGKDGAARAAFFMSLAREGPSALRSYGIILVRDAGAEPTFDAQLGMIIASEGTTLSSLLALMTTSDRAMQAAAAPIRSAYAAIARLVPSVIPLAPSQFYWGNVTNDAPAIERFLTAMLPHRPYLAARLRLGDDRAERFFLDTRSSTYLRRGDVIRVPVPGLAGAGTVPGLAGAGTVPGLAGAGTGPPDARDFDPAAFVAQVTRVAPELALHSLTAGVPHAGALLILGDLASANLR
jgi:hypothetical protein